MVPLLYTLYLSPVTLLRYVPTGTLSRKDQTVNVLGFVATLPQALDCVFTCEYGWTTCERVSVALLQ